MSNSMVFSCVRFITILGYFITEKRKLEPVISHFPFPVSPREQLMYFRSLPILNIFYKWNHVICGLSWLLVSFSMTFSRFIHAIRMTVIQAYLRDTAGSVPDHHSKVNIMIKQVTLIFLFPDTCKSYVYTYRSILSVHWHYVLKSMCIP